MRQLDPALQNAIRKTSNGLAGGIGVKRTQAARVTRVQCLEQVEGFSSPHFADNDSVWPVPQGGFQ